MRSPAGRTLGLVLSGGGARGVFQVGVYEELLNDQRFAGRPMALSGTSAGAMNAALIAAGRSPQEMMDFWNRIADNPPAVASARFFRTAVRTLMRLTLSESIAWLRPGRRWEALVQRARNHVPPKSGSLLALAVEFLLSTRFELVSQFLEGIQEPYLADTTLLRRMLVDTFGGERLPNVGVDLAISTVDAHTGRVVRFATRETKLTLPPDYTIVDAITVDMVLASASIPLLFPPVCIGHQFLWDGGLLVNTPLAPAVALGADEIITVLTTEPPDPFPHPFPNFGRAVERTVDSLLENAYNVDRKLLLERNRLARLENTHHYRDVRLYEPVRPARECFNAGSYLYFERATLAEAYEAGRRAARAWLAAGPRVDDLDESRAGAAA